MEIEGSVGLPLGQPFADAIDALYRSERVRLTRLATAITLDRWIAEDVVRMRSPVWVVMCPRSRTLPRTFNDRS
jgi:hypothetical protein